jgi:hypothetical protein
MGYSSSAHLSAQFKNVTGLTPSQYKTNEKNERKSLDKNLKYYENLKSRFIIANSVSCICTHQSTRSNGHHISCYLTSSGRICYIIAKKEMLNEVKHLGSGCPGKPF